MSDKSDLQSGFWLEEWRVQPDRNRISGPDGHVHLTPRTMEVLLCLAEHAGEVVTRDEFSNEVWHPSVVSDYALTRCISELRGHLGDQAGNGRFIETIPKRGYRLIAPVTLRDPDESAQTDPGAETSPDGTIAAGQKTSRLRLTALGVVFLVSALVAIWAYWPDGRSPAAPPTPDGIAVLPFVNLSPDPNHAIFAAGMHEEVLTHLAHFGDLRVISRSSMQAIAEEGLAVPEIARRLGVSHVLEGSVRRDGNRVRVSAQLIEAASDAHLWAENYDRELTDIFAIQSEIALAIVDELELSLEPRTAARLAQRPTDNIEAYEHYVEGRERLRRPPMGVPSPGEALDFWDQTEDLFRAAIDKDPDFAAAHAALSYTLLSDLRLLSAEEAEAHYHEAVEASRRAIGLEPGLAEGYLTLGKAYYFHGSGDAAWEQFKLAADINPNDPEIKRHLWLIHINRGEYIDALRAIRRASVIDPERPQFQWNMVYTYRRLGLMGQARDANRRAFEQIASNPFLLNVGLAVIAMDEGDLVALREHIDRIPKDTDNPTHAEVLFRLNLELGDMKAAETLFDLHQDYFEQRHPIRAAQVWIHRGDVERAEQVLLAYEQRISDRIPRPWGSVLEYELFWIELLRGRTGEALDHMEAAVDKGFRDRLLEVYGHPDFHPPRAREIAEHPRLIAAQDRIDADLARMRAELAELDELAPRQ